MSGHLGQYDLYTKAGKILDLVQSRKGTAKSLCLSQGKTPQEKRKLYALVCETLKYGSVVKEIIESTGFAKFEAKNIPQGVAQVLVYDHLLGNKLKCGGKYRAAVTRHKASLAAALVRIKTRRGAATNADLLPPSVRLADSIPRYVRVNLLKTTVQDVVQHLLSEGFVQLPAGTPLDKIRKKQFVMDPHLDDVIALAPHTDLHAHPLYLNGALIQQDKASCMPAHALAPRRGSHCIDGCAAPGNKTSHLASLLANTGKIHAFDLDGRRLETLKKLTGLAGATNIVAVHQSFLDVDPQDPAYADVEYILLDPSCSGSGIFSRMDHLIDAVDENGDAGESDALSRDEPANGGSGKQSKKSGKRKKTGANAGKGGGPAANQSERLASLAQFQEQVILHAFKFPRVARVSYSTCSIHREENEDVVQAVLDRCGGGFQLVNALPQWEGRGHDCIPGGYGKLCVRVQPERDHTNGFFVAVFERTGSDQGAIGEAHTANDTSAGVKRKRKASKKKKKKKKKKPNKESIDSLAVQSFISM